MAPRDPLEGLLDEAEARLRQRLREACEAEAQGVTSESAAEIRRLEDSLLSAAMAAEQVLTVRRHIQRNAADAGQSSGRRTAPGTAEPAGETSAPVRPAAVAGGDDRSGDSRAPAKSGEAPDAADRSGDTAVREFTDSAGRPWRAWPVTPKVSSPQDRSRRTLGEFQEGWICFEALDDSGRRRLPRHEPGWANLSPIQLQRLLDEAIKVPGRTRLAPATDRVSPADERLH